MNRQYNFKIEKVSKANIPMIITKDNIYYRLKKFYFYRLTKLDNLVKVTSKLSIELEKEYNKFIKEKR